MVHPDIPCSHCSALVTEKSKDASITFVLHVIKKRENPCKCNSHIVTLTRIPHEKDLTDDSSIATLGHIKVNKFQNI